MVGVAWGLIVWSAGVPALGMHARARTGDASAGSFLPFGAIATNRVAQRPLLRRDGPERSPGHTRRAFDRGASACEEFALLASVEAERANGTPQPAASTRQREP